MRMTAPAPYYREEAEPEALTYREADLLVDAYLSMVADHKNTVTTVSLLREVGLENTHHNRARVHVALEERCEPSGTATRNKRTRFRLPDERTLK